jgi:hypothetical protein
MKGTRKNNWVIIILLRLTSSALTSTRNTAQTDTRVSTHLQSPIGQENLLDFVYNMEKPLPLVSIQTDFATAV